MLTSIYVHVVPRIPSNVWARVVEHDLPLMGCQCHQYTELVMRHALRGMLLAHLAYLQNMYVPWYHVLLDVLATTNGHLPIL